MYDCFTLGPRHFSIIFSQGYVMKHLESSFGKFNGLYGDLIQQHLVPLSRMLNDNLVHNHIQCHPPSFIHYFDNLRTCYWSWPCYWIWPFYWSSRAFHRTYETGVTFRPRKLILLRLPGTDLFMMCTCSRVKSVFPKLVMFPDFWISLCTSIFLAFVFQAEEVYQRRFSSHVLFILNPSWT